ncbi:hypothetical protein ACLQ9N_05115 [Gallibacterium anatis]|uniref:hypothetical protein n=1 Tax=Gallibacterium anatis TaxID=750 RepID=UPI0039FCC79F
MVRGDNDLYAKLGLSYLQELQSLSHNIAPRYDMPQLVPPHLQKLIQQLHKIDPLYNMPQLKAVLRLVDQLNSISLDNFANLTITPENAVYFSPKNIAALEVLAQSEGVSQEKRGLLTRLANLMKAKLPKAAKFVGVTLADSSLRKFFDWLLDALAG